mgnify:CR=1 FL=1
MLKIKKSLGINDLVPSLNGDKIEHLNSFTVALNESSNGKDTMTGHWEMMGLEVKVPFQTFTETGFPKELIDELAKNGQIATQYVDLEGNATSDIDFNPNGSLCAIEGITSPDGRVFGKMGHAERIGTNLYRNVPGKYDMQLFKSAVEYFKK